MRSFVKIESSRIGEIIRSFTDIGKSRPCVANMSFTCKGANYKRKILSVKNNNLKCQPSKQPKSELMYMMYSKTITNAKIH